MYNFILKIALVVSLSVMFYLLARVVSRVKDDEAVTAEEEYWQRLLAKIPVTKIDAWLHLVAAKFLRRLRVIVLKIDNFLHQHLVRMKKVSDKATKEQPSFLESLQNQKNGKDEI